MIDKSVAFTVRRARLLLGMTPSEFASLYGADETTVSRWERGLAQPKPGIWARLRDLTLKASSSLDEDLVKASPVYKYLVDMKDLTQPIVASEGILEALKAVGVVKVEAKPPDIAELARKSPTMRPVVRTLWRLSRLTPGGSAETSSMPRRIAFPLTLAAFGSIRWSLPCRIIWLP